MYPGRVLPPDLPASRFRSRAADAEVPAAHDSRATAVLMLVAGLATVVGVGFFIWCMARSVYTPDFPWLWRSGQYILETRSLPDGDIFSWSRPGEPWVLYQWLFEVVVAAGMQALGFRGLFALFTATAVAVYLLVPLCGGVPRRVSPLFALLPAGLALAVASVNLSLRPMIATSACLLLQYMLVQRLRGGAVTLKTALLLIAPLYLLWANMHTGVILGPLSLAMFALGDLAERRGAYPFRPADRAIEGRPLPLSTYLLLAAAALLASLVNPYGVGIYTYIVELSRESYLNDSIVELQSPSFHELRFQWFLLFVGALAFFLTRARRTLSAAGLLHLVVFTLCTFYAARFVVWSVLFYALILPHAIHHEWIAGARTGRADMLAHRHPAAAWLRAGITVPSLLLPIAYWMLAVEDPSPGLCDAIDPAIAAYLADRRPGERPFTDATVGSCILARERDQRVFIDTRFDFYGTDFTRQATEILQLRPGWRRKLEAWGADAVVVQRIWPLAQAIEADADFETVFAGPNAVVLRRRPAP